MEFLVDLRAGDRKGPQVRQPTSQVAAQLAGTVIEARHITVEDFFHAVAMIEPAMIELATNRMSPDCLATLQSLSSELTVSSQDVPELLRVWAQARRVIFGATGNAALETIAEILQWVRLGTQASVTAYAAQDAAWLAETHRLAALFAELVDAFEAGDGGHAAGIWAQSLNANSPYIESSELGRKLVIDLMGEREGIPWTSLT
jgi:DNA-binding FadR family transcriptional regulator